MTQKALHAFCHTQSLSTHIRLKPLGWPPYSHNKKITHDTLLFCIPGTSEVLGCQQDSFAHSDIYANERLVPLSRLWLCMLKRLQGSSETRSWKDQTENCMFPVFLITELLENFFRQSDMLGFQSHGSEEAHLMSKMKRIRNRKC